MLKLHDSKCGKLSPDYIEQFIIEPQNCVRVKLRYDQENAAMELSMEDLTISLQICKGQYNQMLELYELLNRLNTQRVISFLRPTEPVAVNPFAWWKYTFDVLRCTGVVRMSNINGGLQCFTYGKRYLKLHRQRRELLLTNREEDKRKLSAIERELCNIENALPMYSLSVFRDLVVEEWKNSMPSIELKITSSWPPWRIDTGSGNLHLALKSAEVDQTLMKGILFEVENRSKRHVEGYNGLTLKIVGKWNISLNIFNDCVNPLVRCDLSFAHLVDLCSDHCSGTFSVNDIVVTDLATMGTERSRLICSVISLDSSFQVRQEATRAYVFEIDVNFGAIECFLHESCMSSLCKFFRHINGFNNLLCVENRCCIDWERMKSSMNVQVSSLVVSFCDSRDNEVLCIETGKVILMSGIRNYVYKMEALVEDLYAFVYSIVEPEGKKDALTHPFSFTYEYKIDSSTDPKMNILLEIHSCLSTVLDEPKMFRLLRSTDTIVATHEFLGGVLFSETISRKEKEELWKYLSFDCRFPRINVSLLSSNPILSVDITIDHLCASARLSVDNKSMKLSMASFEIKDSEEQLTLKAPMSPVPLCSSSTLPRPYHVPANAPKRAKVLFDTPEVKPGDLPIKAGQILVILRQEGDWWFGHINGDEEMSGYFPRNYVELLSEKVEALDCSNFTSPIQKSHSSVHIRAEVLYRYIAEVKGDLSLDLGDTVVVCEQDGNWWYGYIEGTSESQSGYFPFNYVQLLEREDYDQTQTMHSSNHSSSPPKPIFKHRDELALSVNFSQCSSEIYTHIEIDISVFDLYWKMDASPMVSFKRFLDKIRLLSIGWLSTHFSSLLDSESHKNGDTFGGAHITLNTNYSIFVISPSRIIDGFEPKYECMMDFAPISVDVRFNQGVAEILIEKGGKKYSGEIDKRVHQRNLGGVKDGSKVDLVHLSVSPKTVRTTVATSSLRIDSFLCEKIFEVIP